MVCIDFGFGNNFYCFLYPSVIVKLNLCEDIVCLVGCYFSSVYAGIIPSLAVFVDLFDKLLFHSNSSLNESIIPSISEA